MISFSNKSISLRTRGLLQFGPGSGLDRTARYEVTNFDIEGPMSLSGKELMEKGLLITLKNQPDSALIVYKRLK